MADRSMLFAVAALPSETLRSPANMGLCEIPYHLPAMFKLLVSANPQLTSSLIFDEDGGPLAIAGEARTGLQRLREFRSRLPDSSEAAPNIDAALEFLSEPHLAQFPYFLFEPGEILGLSDAPVDRQLEELLEEIRTLTYEDLLTVAETFYDRDWPDYWTDILYFEPGGRVRPPVNAKDELLFTTPEHLLENDALLSSAAAKQVTLEFEAGDPLLDRAIAALGKLPQLARLRLEGACTQLPDGIGNLTNLTTFIADGIGLTDLPASFAKLTKLEGLYLQRNQFQEVPIAIRSLKNLDDLSLWGMPLTRLPPWIGELTGLRSLLLAQCALTHLPEELFSISSLASLDVSQNTDLAALPNDVSKATSLETLSAVGCRLTTLPDSIGLLPSLASLYVGETASP